MPYAPAVALVLALAAPTAPPPTDGPQSRPAPERWAQQQGYTCATPEGSCALSYPLPVGSGCSCPIGGRPVSGRVQP